MLPAFLTRLWAPRPVAPSPAVRRTRLNISQVLPRIDRAVKAMTVAELQRGVEAEEWDGMLLTGPRQGLAQIKAARMRQELTRRAARDVAAGLDPHPLSV